MKALVWPVATFGCESWTLRKNEETRFDAFENYIQLYSPEYTLAENININSSIQTAVCTVKKTK